MMLILMIALIAAVDLCIKEEIEARDGSEFPKELIGTDGKISSIKATIQDSRSRS